MNKGLNNLPEFINPPKPPKRKIHDDLDIVKGVNNYCQVEETWFTDLNQILAYLGAVSSDDYLKLCLYTSLKKGYNIQPDTLYELIYNPDIHDSGPVTLSIHRTREGAEAAMQAHKDQVKAEFNDMYHNSDYPVDMVVDMEWDDNQYWDVKPIKIEE